MIVRREALASALAGTTADDTRYFLNGVQVRQNGDVASTDGHVAFIVHDNSPMDSAEFPIVAGAEIHGEMTRDLLVPVDTCKRLIGATAKGKRSLPILSGIKIGRNGDDNTTVLVASDLSVPAIATIVYDPANAPNFPPLDRVIPAADTDCVRVTLGVPVLESLIKAAKAIAGSKSFQSVTLQFPKTDKADKTVLGAIRVEITGESLSIVGAAMPARL